ncbi:uncharacterized protein MONOS_15922 [Monocercomonoides exilis]|uniref:uncharacterized protein n=1 Tax=Monocercomonoides exilis TaxID=2049356 RepID=UPI003559E1C0|nr:hypothetical protein MONOS_15922 [Monocercomonoides exilis]|eukprot:MONOS_15922.1-p1 / transcript=MONOS_15922.1 / gene=MONOS_15922 / organism=Monocercomonoides_exilis_PA203 / gene_product=unspecified product / transcript_product=unspecified product / location=Mono_scaffold01409:754-5435(-) / protein_length=1488 / sequence_SO=supercontig / SO=protein_coding / is_pseudo=false
MPISQSRRVHSANVHAQEDIMVERYIVTCIANSGGVAAGSLTFNWPPQIKPSQFSINECQFANNELTSTSSTRGGAGIYLDAFLTWMNEIRFITFCFFDGNTATNGRGNDVFFNGNAITQSPFQQCGSTTPTNRVWNQGTADNAVYNRWLPLITTFKIVSNNGTNTDLCGITQLSPCKTIEHALVRMTDPQDASLTLLTSTFVPTQTLTFSAVDTKITGNGTDATTIASSGIPQPQNSHSQSSQSTSSFSSFSSFSSASSSPDPSASSALFQQTQGSLTVSALAIAHNSTNTITPILFHLSGNSPSLNLNTTTITGTTSITIKTPLFFLTAGSLALNHTAITSLSLNSQSIFHLTFLSSPLTLNSSNITDITSTATPTSCVLSSATSPALSLSLANCTITNINSEQLSQQTATNGGCISFASTVSDNTFSVSDTIFSSCCVNEDVSDGGKGGGIYLDCSLNEGGFQLSSISFSGCSATVGKNMFVKSGNLVASVNTERFAFDCTDYKDDENAFVGEDGKYGEMDLRVFLVSLKWMVVSVSKDGHDTLGCGSDVFPCYSIEHGLAHLTSEYVSLLYVDTESVIGEEISLKEMNLSSKSRGLCEVEVKSGITKAKDCLITTTGTVSLMRANFVFDPNFVSQHESLISPEGGILEIVNCSFSSKQLTEGVNEVFAIIPFHIFNMEKGELQLMECTISNLILHESALHLSSPLLSVIYLLTICNSTIITSLVNINECGQLTIKDFKTENITVEGNEESLISCLSMKKTVQLTNCTMERTSSKTTKGKLMKVENCLDVKMDSCIFDGSAKERNEQKLNAEEEMCRWDGSLVDVVKSSVIMKDTTMSNSPKGGITMSGGNVLIEAGNFSHNNPSIEGYPSLRRNIICSDSGTLNVMSLKGGDGVLPNTSLWMLNEGCSFEGIVSERDSSFFIPVLESAEAKETTDRLKLTFKGLLLVPCNLSFAVVKSLGEEKEIEKHDFGSNGFLSEREVEGSMAKDLISSCGNEIEVSVHILFGNAESPSSTNSFILKNASEPQSKGDEKLVEGGKEGKSSWASVVIAIFAVLFLIALIGFILFVIRWKKAKNENKDLRKIVNNNIKKDPKAFEMVTMEMSPEEQWRREEKKNEERIKKRVYEKTMEHSESSEYLLSESGSTEYILGKDSDKIPEWVLEKEDEKEEEEETRRRSPSISSTDTETTFVRMEDLCPTTSSMSNLVDAMACSSPHEKLIVDLRDSLFMLLHGRNEKKEMEIGSLQQREQTAAQILFWVANLALHSFDEMDNPLQSLGNLSPHIVLFSEHMVICIVMHSDLLSDDDSDSSSISSSTIVTSASDDDDDDDSLPSSAFEDEDSFKKECLRWKAPELQVNRKMGATKESVAFSIGMMLWECLTLEIPFGEYAAEVAGEKIGMFEMPNMAGAEGSSLWSVVKGCVEQEASRRMTLVEVKRELISHFPKDALVMTMSDAVEVVETRREEGGEENEMDEKEGKKVKEGECN